MRRYGHVERISMERRPKKVLNWTTQGKRTVRRPRMMEMDERYRGSFVEKRNYLREGTGTRRLLRTRGVEKDVRTQ